MRNKATQRQLALIHIAKKDLCLADEVYRDILYRVTGKWSAAELTEREADAVLADLNRFGFKPVIGNRCKYDELGKRPGRASPARMRKLEALWVNVSHGRTYEDKHRALKAFLGNRFGQGDITLLSSRQVNNAIEAVKDMQERMGRH